MRLTLLTASAAIAACLAVSACNSSSTAPSASAITSSGIHMTAHNGHPLWVRPAHGVKILSGISCDYSKYNFCFYVEPGNSGPYVSTSDGSSPLYNAATITKSKNGKVAKKFSTYFYPDPGDPTSQYITFKGKVKKVQPVKYTDNYCIGFTPSECANGSGSELHLGIALEP
jgi:hypothetical protein